MDTLPVPKLRANWASAVILTCILFLVYYLFLFDAILGNYQRQFFNETVTLENANVNLEITAHVPRYVYSSNAVWVYIEVRNLGQSPLSNVNIYLNTDTTDRSYKYMLPEIYEDENSVYHTAIEFKTIQQSEITSGRLRFLSQNKTINIKGVIVTIGENAPVSLDFGAIQPIRWNSWALKHSFFENILLPPWSNGLIFALSLFSAYLVNKKKKPFSNGYQPQENVPDFKSKNSSDKTEDDEQETLTFEWYRLVWNNLFWSSVILLVVVGLIFVFLNTFILFVVEFLYLVLVLVCVRVRECSFRGLLIVLGAILGSFSILLTFDFFRLPEPFSDIYPLLPASHLESFGIGWFMLVSTSLTVIAWLIIVFSTPLNKKQLHADSKKQENADKKNVKKKSGSLLAFWNKRYKHLESKIKTEFKEIHKGRPKDENLWREFYETNSQSLTHWGKYVERLKHGNYDDYEESGWFWRWIDKIYTPEKIKKIIVNEDQNFNIKARHLHSQPESDTKSNE